MSKFLAIKELQKIVSDNADIKSLLLSSIKSANVRDIKTLSGYYKYLDTFLKWIPIEKNRKDFYSKLIEFYWFIDQPSGILLQGKEEFNEWLLHFIQSMDLFLDTPGSAIFINDIIKDKKFHISNYMCPSGGWKNFNEFVARKIKVHKRPIERYNDEEVLVFPSDGTFLGVWDINDKSSININNITIYIREFLLNSAYRNQFIGGKFCHIFLNYNDYQRYHSPIEGVILDKKIVPGLVSFDIKKRDKKIISRNGNKYQFVQDRGIIIINNKHLGLIALVPIGLIQLASVAITKELGCKVVKGEELGYFKAGGSDFVMIFANQKIACTAEVGKHYKQGQQIAILNS